MKILQLKMILCCLLFCTIACEKDDRQVKMVIFIPKTHTTYSPFYTIDEKDIECVDWEHQAFKVNDSVILNIKQLRNFGPSNEYIAVCWGNDTIYKAWSWSSAASCFLHYDSPRLIVNRKNDWSFFNDGWLTVDYSFIDKKEDWRIVFDRRLYNHWKDKQKLKGKNWICTGEMIENLSIQPSENMSRDYEQHTLELQQGIR
jgi:hypothetical protein